MRSQPLDGRRLGRFLHLIPCVMGLLLALPSAAQPSIQTADGAWTLASTPGPGMKHEHFAAYDPVDDRMIVFGNRYEDAGNAETWSLSFSPTPHWTLLSTTRSPSGRSSGSFIYDPLRHRMILFGGYDGSYQNDVWELSLSGTPEWTKIVPGGVAPIGRHWCTGVYDANADRMIFIGGYRGGPTLNDVWALDLASGPQWHQLSPTGTFQPTYGHVAVYDGVNNRVVTWGGSNATLSQLQLSPTPAWSVLGASGGGPPARRYSSVVLDTAEQRMILFAGYDSGPSNQAWELTLGATPAWRLLSPTGTAPAATRAHTSVLRTMDHSMIAFGGVGTPVGQISVLALDAGVVTTTTLATSPNPSTCGESVTLSIAVSPSAATGIVDILDGGTIVDSAALQAGNAEVQLSTLSAGTHSLRAAYRGDALRQASTSTPVVQMVQAGPTTMTLFSDANPSVFGQPVGFHATVTPAGATGVVDFFVEPAASPFATQPVVGGAATASTSTLPVGTMTIRAEYRGDACNAPSTSTFEQIVLLAPSTIALTSTPNPSASIAGPSLVAVVSPSSTTGSVEFFDGPQSLGSAALAGGTGTRSVSLSVGEHSLTAVYGGDGNHAGATSSPIQHVVLPTNPVLVGVHDVPHDQGGRVFLTWRCYVDSAGFQIVTGYRVWRRVPNLTVAAPSSSGDPASTATNQRTIPMAGPDGTLQDTFWEAIATLPSQLLVSYGYTAPTNQDSLRGSNPYEAFFVTALTVNPFVFYDSSIDSGYSVDNLSPVMPHGLVGSWNGSATDLAWQANGEADLMGYRLYRGSTAGFTPAPDNLAAFVEGTRYHDDASDLGYWKMSAVDVHGNEGPHATLSWSVAVDEPVLTGRVRLEPAAPSPVRDRTSLKFELPTEDHARLEVFDVSGRRVRRLVDERLPAGVHAATFDMKGEDGQSLEPGIYLVRLIVGSASQSQRIVLAK